MKGKKYMTKLSKTLKNIKFPNILKQKHKPVLIFFIILILIILIFSGIFLKKEHDANNLSTELNSTPSQYTLTFLNEDNSVISEEKILVGKPIHLFFESFLSKQGMKFDWVDEDGKIYYEGIQMPKKNLSLHPSYKQLSTKPNADRFFKYQIFKDSDGNLVARVLNIDDSLYDGSSEINIPKDISFKYTKNNLKTHYNEKIQLDPELDLIIDADYDVTVKSVYEFWYNNDLGINKIIIPDCVIEYMEHKGSSSDKTIKQLNIPYAIPLNSTFPLLKNYTSLETLYLPNSLREFPDGFLEGAVINTLDGPPEINSYDFAKATITSITINETNNKESINIPAVDIDLSSLDYSTAESKLLEINDSYDDYKGQTIKLTGSLTVVSNTENNNKQYYCVLNSNSGSGIGLSFDLKNKNDLKGFNIDENDFNSKMLMTGKIGYNKNNRFIKILDATIQPIEENHYIE